MALENPVAYNSRQFEKPTRIMIDDSKYTCGDDRRDAKHQFCSSQKRFIKRMVTCAGITVYTNILQTVGPNMFLILLIAVALIFWTMVYFLNI